MAPGRARDPSPEFLLSFEAGSRHPMTKLRDPLSLDAALAKVAGQVPGDWKTLAAIAGRTASTVRSWAYQRNTRRRMRNS
mgnify:CR=1 FL=1